MPGVFPGGDVGDTASFVVADATSSGIRDVVDDEDTLGKMTVELELDGPTTPSSDADGSRISDKRIEELGTPLMNPELDMTDSWFEGVHEAASSCVDAPLALASQLEDEGTGVGQELETKLDG